MTFSVAAVLLGLLIVYAGWKNLSLWALLRGDDKTPKGKVQGGGVGSGTVRTSTGTKNG